MKLGCGDTRNAYRTLVEKPFKMSTCNTDEAGVKCNINMDLREAVCKVGRCMELAQDRIWRALVLAALNLGVYKQKVFS
jgi:hypothetical protein